MLQMLSIMLSIAASAIRKIKHDMLIKHLAKPSALFFI